MATSMSNGYQIEYINNQWIYSDTKESVNIIRPCKYCGKLPTENGYDECLGYLPNVKSACCGHGVGKPYVVFNNGEYMQFENIDELKKYFQIENKRV